LKERKREKKEKMKQKKLSKEVRLVELYEDGKRKRGIGDLSSIILQVNQPARKKTCEQ